jgi:hypothetical protein
MGTMRGGVAARVLAALVMVVPGAALSWSPATAEPELAGAVAAIPVAPRAVGAETGHYLPVVPQRILDTRKPVSATNPSTGAFGPGQVRELVVAGVAGVPADATAVVVNVTVTGGSAASDLRVWPAGAAVPQISNLNWAAGETVPNLVTVGVGDGGRIAIRNQTGSAHVIVDVQGAFGPAGERYQPLQPQRIVDSRTAWGGALGPEESRDLAVAGVNGVPTDASAIVLNLTVTGGTVASDLRAFRAGGPHPQVSNLNWPKGDTRANLAVVPIGDGGEITLRNQAGSVHVVVDMVGYVGPGADDVFEPVDPFRLFDTRAPSSPLTGRFSSGQIRVVDVTGTVPVDATAVVVNLTVVGGSEASNLRAWPAGQATPNSSNLNWPAGATRPNLAIVPIGDGGRISFRNKVGTVHVIGDVVGYFVGAEAGPGQWTDVSPELPTLEGLGLNTVSCVGVDYCMAAGDRPMPAGSFNAEPFVIVWDGSDWTEIVPPDLTPGPPPSTEMMDSQFIDDMSCVSPTFCGVVITRSYDDDTSVYAGIWDGVAWSLHLDDWGPQAPRSIFCTPDGTCTVFGEFAEVWNGTAWESANSGGFVPVDCISRTFCIGRDLWSTVPGLVKWDGSTLTAMPVPDDFVLALPADPFEPARGEATGACSTPTECVYLQNGVAPAPPEMLRWDGLAWERTEALPQGLDAWRAEPYMPWWRRWSRPVVSCASPHDCLGLGRFGSESRTYRLDGTQWGRAADPPVPEVGPLSCATGWCMMVSSDRAFRYDESAG